MAVAARIFLQIILVDKYLAQGYLNFLYSPRGQQIAAQNFYRPRNEKILAEFADRFPKVTFFNVNQTFGDWPSIQKTHFNDGGVFDQIYTAQ